MDLNLAGFYFMLIAVMFPSKAENRENLEIPLLLHAPAAVRGDIL